MDRWSAAALRQALMTTLAAAMGCSAESSSPVNSDWCHPVCYGPPLCHTDEECVAEYGKGWYCDQDNVFMCSCGPSFLHPVCVKYEDAGKHDAAADSGTADADASLDSGRPDSDANPADISVDIGMPDMDAIAESLNLPDAKDGE